jgi:hypothetical protein
VGFEDLGKVVFFAVLLLFWMFGKKKEADERKKRAQPGHHHPAPTVPVPTHRAPVPRDPHPVEETVARRAPVGALPHDRPTSQTLAGLRPQHIVSSRVGGQDSPLSDYEAARTLQKAGPALAAVADRGPEGPVTEVTLEALRNGFVWKEILSPPRALARRAR